MVTVSKQDFENLKKRLAQRAERLRGELQQVEDDLRAASRTYELLNQEDAEVNPFDWTDDYLRRFEGLSQIQSLVKFAKDNGNNRLRVSEAKRLFIAAHLSKSKKNITNILHSTLDRSERFRKVSPGEYELVLKPTSVTSPYDTKKQSA